MKNNFTPEQIAEIQEIVKNFTRDNYLSGNPTIDPHTHNGTDNLQINPVDLIGWTPLPMSSEKYLNPAQNEYLNVGNPGKYEYGFASNEQLKSDSSGLPQYLSNATLAIYPIPIVNGYGVGNAGAFNGGYAPEGALVFFENGNTLSNLYIRINGKWRGVNFNLTA